jgi:serum/glucocorticoid-regulated kinase 2
MFDSDGHIILSDFTHADFESSTEQCGIPKKSLAAIMPEYIAPETLLGWARNAAADCWSFGVLVYFMLYGTVRLSVTNPLSTTEVILSTLLENQTRRLAMITSAIELSNLQSLQILSVS